MPAARPEATLIDDPDTFEPYGVGYVELPGEVRVEARLTEADPGRLRIGLPMELTLVPAPGGAGGGCHGGRPPVASTARGVVTYAFRPMTEEEQSER